MDFQKILEQFKGTTNLKYIKENRSWQTSPDELFYEIDTSDGIHYIFEVDYIGDFNQDVVVAIENEIGKFSKMFEVNFQQDLEESNPFKTAKVYNKPLHWNFIAKYANDKYGSAPYYFNFLIKK